MENQSIIVGDIGGTNVRLALANKNNEGKIELNNIFVKPVSDFQSLEHALEFWRKQIEIFPNEAVFGLAGVTGGDEVRFTNSNWVVVKKKLIEQFGFKKLQLINDFATQAVSIINNSQDLIIINKGIENLDAPKVVLGPGTGLGMAGLVKSNNIWKVLETEGGHQAFAPRTEIEIEILKILSNKFGVVSYENLLSGPGLLRIYNCLAQIRGEAAILNTPPQIGQAAALKTSNLAIEAAQTLTLILATFCSNAVLAYGAKGGCVIAGGVSKQLSQFLMTKEFINRFKNIGPMEKYVHDVPLMRNNDEYAALKGAAFLHNNL